MRDKRTKIELIQANQALAAENAKLREQLSIARFERETAVPSFKARCEAARKLAMESGKVVSVTQV